LKGYEAMVDKLLRALEEISEQLAEWSLNDGCLDNKNISPHEIRQKERLELILEAAIVEAGGKW
jgi:hypothetical protein